MNHTMDRSDSLDAELIFNSTSCSEDEGKDSSFRGGVSRPSPSNSASTRPASSALTSSSSGRSSEGPSFSELPSFRAGKAADSEDIFGLRGLEDQLLELRGGGRGNNKTDTNEHSLSKGFQQQLQQPPLNQLGGPQFGGGPTAMASGGSRPRIFDTPFCWELGEDSNSSKDSGYQGLVASHQQGLHNAGGQLQHHQQQAGGGLFPKRSSSTASSMGMESLNSPLLTPAKELLHFQHQEESANNAFGLGNGGSSGSQGLFNFHQEPAASFSAAGRGLNLDHNNPTPSTSALLQQQQQLENNPTVMNKPAISLQRSDNNIRQQQNVQQIRQHIAPLYSGGHGQQQPHMGVGRGGASSGGLNDLGGFGLEPTSPSFNLGCEPFKNSYNNIAAGGHHQQQMAAAQRQIQLPPPAVMAAAAMEQQHQQLAASAASQNVLSNLSALLQLSQVNNLGLDALSEQQQQGSAFDGGLTMGGGFHNMPNAAQVGGPQGFRGNSPHQQQQGGGLPVSPTKSIVDPNMPGSQSPNSLSMSIRSKFGSLGSGQGQFDSPHGFCLGLNQEIIIADTNNNRIQIYDKTGQFRGQFGTSGKEDGFLMYPRKVAVTSDGKFVVCDRGNERSRMQIFSPSGRFIRRIPLSYVHVVAGVAVNASGHIVVVDSVNKMVWEIAETGHRLGCIDIAKFDVKEPSDITVRGRNYYITDFKGHSVCVVDDKGGYVKKIGYEGVTSFPNGIDISDAGDILVGDSHGNQFHIAVFDPSGSKVQHFHCPTVKVSRCCGLKITREGLIVTLAKNNHHVLILNTLFVR